MADTTTMNRSDCRPPVLQPPPATLAPRDRLIELARRLSRTLTLARALVQGGRTLNLTGIDDGIGMLCAQTLDLCAEEARDMRPTLHEVMAQIDLLTAAIRAAGPDNTAC